MNGVQSLWCVVGGLAGVGHAASLWRSAMRPGQAGAAALVRLLVVALVLVAGARAQQLLPAAAGWAGGLAVTGLLLYARKSA